MAPVGKREQEPILTELRKAGKQIVSISRLNTMDGCPYEAYLNYVLHKKGESNVYATLGDAIHNELQAIMDGNSTVANLMPTLQNALGDLDVLGTDFPKDSQGGNSIREAWVADMTHFCKNFAPPRGKFTTEDFCLLKVTDDLYLQGYIDLTQYHDDGSISIWDWKTSSKFKKSDLLHYGRQPVLYAMAKEQEGVKVRNIGWIMLKYVSVTFFGKARANAKQSSELTKVVNRGKLVKELVPYLKADLLESGMDELSVGLLLDQAVAANDMRLLPEEIASRYTIKPYVQKYDLTDEVRQEALTYVKEQSARLAEYGEAESNYPPRDFFRWGKGGKRVEDCFYCHALCGYGKQCKYIREHDLRQLAEGAKEDNELMELF